MFARMKKSGKYQYLQLVENRKEAGKVRQQVIATVGRLDQLQEKGRVETLIRSLSRFSEQVLLILSGKSEVAADARAIGPVLVFERLWQESKIQSILKRLLAGRKFGFDVERAIFLTVLHRLMISGSDRFCDQWKRDYLVNGADDLQLHHFYRAMSFLGEELEDQSDALPFAPHRNKDLIEEKLFAANWNLFFELGLVFFDTTSIYFEGTGGQAIGQRGHSKDHRPDLKQMVVGVLIMDVLGRAGRFSEVYPESSDRTKPAPLKVKEVKHNGKRYIVCLNERQARKDAADRQAIIESLEDQLKKGATSLVGNKGYRKYLKVDKGSARIDKEKVEAEARFDGKWVLTTDTTLSAPAIALKYKELWQVERVFRDMKSMLETRPVYHQKDANIAGHVFCSFLALVLRKELEQRLTKAGHQFEWSDIKQDLKALKLIEMQEGGNRFMVRTQCKGHCGKILQSLKVALPPTIKALD